MTFSHTCTGIVVLKNKNNISPSISLPYLPVVGVGAGVGAGVGGGVRGGVGAGQSSSTLFPVRVILLLTLYWEPSDRRTVSPQLKLGNNLGAYYLEHCTPLISNVFNTFKTCCFASNTNQSSRQSCIY